MYFLIFVLDKQEDTRSIEMYTWSTTIVTLPPQAKLDFCKNPRIPRIRVGAAYILFIHVRMGMLGRIVHVF